MDKDTRFTLKEVLEAAKATQPSLTYKTLYGRFRMLRQRGVLPENADAASLTWAQAREILRVKRRVRVKCRKEAVAILRQQMRNDGLT